MQPLASTALAFIPVLAGAASLITPIVLSKRLAVRLTRIIYPILTKQYEKGCKPNYDRTFTGYKVERFVPLSNHEIKDEQGQRREDIYVKQTQLNGDVIHTYSQEISHNPNPVIFTYGIDYDEYMKLNKEQKLDRFLIMTLATTITSGAVSFGINKLAAIVFPMAMTNQCIIINTLASTVLGSMMGAIFDPMMESDPNLNKSKTFRKFMIGTTALAVIGYIAANKLGMN